MTPKTFQVTVEGIGRLSFRRRTVADVIAISAEQSRLMRGADGPDALLMACYTQAVLTVLRERDANEWNPDELDGLDPGSFAQIQRVFEALRESEERFRKGPEVQSAPAGEGT